MTTPDPIQPLSDAELSAITGVKMRHRKLPAEKVVEVLSRAKIWHWLGDDGRVITTRDQIQRDLDDALRAVEQLGAIR